MMSTRLAFLCMTIFVASTFTLSVPDPRQRRMPDDEFQSHIQMDGKVPVLVIKQVALDQQQRPIEYSISYCRSDLYVFVCEE